MYVSEHGRLVALTDRRYKKGRRIHLRLGKRVSGGAVGAHKTTVGQAQEGRHALLGKTVRPRPSSYAAWAWRELECALSLRWDPAGWSACMGHMLTAQGACTACGSTSRAGRMNRQRGQQAHRQRVPQALHSKGLSSGPLLHCGDSAEQVVHFERQGRGSGGCSNPQGLQQPP